MNQDKSLYTRQIDSRVFNQDMEFPSSTDLTPTLKNPISLEKTRKIPIKSPLSFSSQSETQMINPSQLLKKIQFLENNFQWILECLKKTVKDHNKQHGELLKKIQTIKRSEEQTQRLIERQDQMVQIFQQKIHQLQQIIKEQEIKLVHAQSTLNQARLSLTPK